MLADIRPALRAYLLADTAVSTAVDGAGALPRIFPYVLPQGIKAPSLVFNVVSETTDHTTDGPSGLVMVRMQIDAYASTPDEADSLARAVKERIDGFRGPMPYGSASPPDAVQVQAVFAETARTDFQSDAGLFRVSRDYLIHYAER